MEIIVQHHQDKHLIRDECQALRKQIEDPKLLPSLSLQQAQIHLHQMKRHPLELNNRFQTSMPCCNTIEMKN
jgi:hypothetical protein